MEYLKRWKHSIKNLIVESNFLQIDQNTSEELIKADEISRDMNIGQYRIGPDKSDRMLSAKFQQ
jgi:hypothetical protein